MQLTLPSGKKLSLKRLRTVASAYQRECPAVLDLFDKTNRGPHNKLREIDLVSLNALNAFGRASPMAAMTYCWEAATRARIEDAVCRITRAPLEQLNAPELTDQATHVDDAICVIDAVDGFGYTSSTKLLHRMRPNVTPIWDVRIAKWYPTLTRKTEWTEWLQIVYSQVLAPENREVLKELRKSFPYPLPLLRIWDIVLWQYS